MKRLLSTARARLSKVRARRPLALSLAGVLLVALVGVTVLLQVRAHASPSPVKAFVVSDAGDPFTDGAGNSGLAAYTWGNFGCLALTTDNFCNGGAWPPRVSIPGAHWIWEFQNTQQPPAGSDVVTFSKTFSIPANATSIAGTMQIAADNGFDLQVNGAEVGSGHNWQNVFSFDLGSALHTGQNTVTVTATNDCCFDAFNNPAGLLYRVDYSYVPDSTPPTTAANIAGLSGSNGWYRGPVTLTLQASDPDDDASTLAMVYSVDGGSTWATYSGPVKFAQDGQYTVQYRSSDPAGNVEATHTATINLDQTSPELHISGSASTTYSFCAGTMPTRPTFAPTDTLSGLDNSQGDSWTTPSSATGAGAYTYTAHARDMAGNSAQETRTYTVAYGSAFGGVLSPVDTDGSSSFNLGSTIPIKFQLLCNGVPVSNAVASLMVSQNGSAPGKAISTSAATTGNLFRYDSTSQQYIFNLSMKNGYTQADGSKAAFTSGTWTLTIVLDDGSSQAYTIALS